MHASVRALLSQLIDYAGLFPPAQLPLEEALPKYLDAKTNSPHRWMLARFVCPTAKLAELAKLAKGTQLQVTALGKQANSASEFVPQVKADIAAINEFRKQQNDAAAIDAMEVALPKDGIGDQLCDVADLRRDAKLTCYLELPRTATWPADVEKLAASANGFGLKLRCGGQTAAAFPSDSEVAWFIDRCRSIPWKATAGLHHPHRHFDKTLQLWHHGFLNVFLAGLFAQVHSLSEADIAEILADRDGTHFRFEDASIAWKQWSLTTPQIEQGRRSVTTFGSCSFDEPVEDLKALGLLD